MNDEDKIKLAAIIDNLPKHRGVFVKISQLVDAIDMAFPDEEEKNEDSTLHKK